MPDNYMKIRVSEDEKQAIKEYCANQGLTVSGMLRYLIFKAMKESDDTNGET